MAHPYESLKNHQISKSRVSKITHGKASATPKIHRATGGRVPDTEVKHAAKIEGEAAPRRADRVERKKGGRVKGASVNINVISAPSAAPGGAPPGGPMLPPPGGPPMPPAPGPMPPRPPMGAGPMAPGLAGSGPSGIPGMMPRATGGRVKSGPAWAEGIEEGTQVQHDPGKNQKLLKPAPAKRATGGKVGKLNAPQGVDPATKLPGGAGGGLGRLAKAHKYGG